MTHEAVRRKRAVDATLARYRGKAFDWSKGVTCVHMARFHLRNMGHTPPTLPRFRSALGAKKALKELGFGSVSAMLGSMLPPVAPAAMLVGDLCAIEGEAGLEAIFIWTGLRTMFGWADVSATPIPAVSVNLDKLAGAWRV